MAKTKTPPPRDPWLPLAHEGRVEAIEQVMRAHGWTQIGLSRLTPFVGPRSVELAASSLSTDEEGLECIHRVHLVIREDGTVSYVETIRRGPKSHGDCVAIDTTRLDSAFARAEASIPGRRFAWPGEPLVRP